MPAGRPRKTPSLILAAGTSRDLITRPGKGWTSWDEGGGGGYIEQTWWEARILHLPKDNATIWFDGSERVGIELWGVHGGWWCMRKPPADWQPPPPGYREAAERVWYAHRRWRLHQERHTARLMGPRRWKLDELPRECGAA